MLPGLITKGFGVTVLGSSEECKKRIQSYLDQGKVLYQTGSLLALPFNAQSFEVTLSFRLLSHLEKWKELVAELCRVSKKKVIVDFPVWRSLNVLSDLFFFFKKNVEKNTRYYTLFHESEMILEFEKNGFTPCQCFPQFFLPMAFHRMLRNKPFSVLTEHFFRSIGLTRWFGSPLIYEFERRQDIP